MRFTVRSLGGKLVISAALTLLLCMLLFSAASWYFLKSFYELEAKNDARIHLAVIKKSYQTQTNALIRQLKMVINTSTVKALLAKPNQKSSHDQLINVLTKEAKGDDLSSLTIVST